MSTPTRFTHGVTTASKNSPTGILGFPDPMRWMTFFEDFVEGTTFPLATSTLASNTNWTLTVTEAGAGAGTAALLDALGGQLRLGTAAGANDAIWAQKVGEAFLWQPNKRLILKAAFKPSEASAMDLALGLIVTDTTPLDVDDGIFFIKPTGATALTLRIEKNDAAAVVPVGAVTTGWNVVAMSYDGRGNFDAWFGAGATVAAAETALARVGRSTRPATAPDDEELRVSFGLQNGSAAVRTLDIDYIFVALER